MAFTSKSASKLLIRSIAQKYVHERYSTLASIGDQFKLTEKMVSDLLFRGIAEDLVSNDIADAIYDKIVHCKKNGRIQRRNRWEKAFDMRTEVRYKAYLEAKAQTEKIEANAKEDADQLATAEA